jgi:peptidoglycan/LPS O-acetylase OafA/YrhL
VNHPTTRASYIPALDGIRLLAVILVVLHHLTRGSATSAFLHLIGLQRNNGIGPTLFFVLSGVLLTTVILNSRNAPRRYPNFLMRRVLRIFPLYFGYLTLAVVATWIITGAPPQNLWVFAFFLQNNFLHAASNTGSVIPMYHLWTLAIQDQFYLLWPPLLWKCDSTRSMRRLCFGLIGLSLLARIVIAHPYLSPEIFGRILPSYVGAMALGALISLEAREQTLLTPILRRAFLPLTLLCGIWMWHGLNIQTTLGSIVGLQLIALVCGALIVAALAPRSWTARILGSKYFALGGKKYAFAIYIFHPLLLDLCMRLNASKGVRLAVFAAVTMAISAISYRWFERPFLQMPVGRTSQTPQSGTPNNVPVLPSPHSLADAIPSLLHRALRPTRTR